MNGHDGFANNRGPGRVKVGFIDDHDLILAGARALMSAHNSPADFVVGAKTVTGLIDSRHELDVVVLDVRLSDGSVTEENVDRLVAHGWRVLLHADLRHREAGPTLQRSAASGLVWKNHGVLNLLEAIVTVAHGQTWSTWIPEQSANREVRLTARELQVLRSYACGRTYAQTAATLDPPIGVESVKTYLARIRKRYDDAGRPAATRIELRQRALEDGIIPPE